MAHIYLSASLPLSSDMDLIIQLLKETSKHGLPSELSIGDIFNESHYLSLQFQAGYGLPAPEWKIPELLTGFENYAKVVEDCANQPHELLAFHRLEQSVNALLTRGF